MKKLLFIKPTPKGILFKAVIATEKTIAGVKCTTIAERAYFLQSEELSKASTKWTVGKDLTAEPIRLTAEQLLSKGQPTGIYRAE